jgi:hypothetical protein
VAAVAGATATTDATAGFEAVIITRDRMETRP